jgi:hypothetical protein
MSLRNAKWKPNGLIPRNGQVWQNFLTKAVAQKGCFANDDDDDDDKSAIKFI